MVNVSGRMDRIPIPTAFPSTTRCLQITIPDGDEYVLMLFRALGWLANWTTYERDVNKSGAQVAELWKAAINGCLPEAECSLLTDVRQKDGQPCILEKNLSGEWQPFANLRYCPPNLRISGGKIQYFDEGTQTWVDYPTDAGGTPGTQPGEQPDGDQPITSGQCVQMNVTVRANELTVIPFRVLPGDTVVLENVQGGWTTNYGVVPLVQWTCGNGKIYALGQCGNDDGSDAGDLIVTVPAGKLICQYGTSYFDALDSQFTIPSGWDEDMLILRINDSVLTDNAGSVTVDVRVCSGAWCYLWDFATGDQGWDANYSSGTTPAEQAVYSANAWRQQVTRGNAYPNNYWSVCDIVLAATGVTAHKITVRHTSTKGNDSGIETGKPKVQIDIDGSFVASQELQEGPETVFTGNFTITSQLRVSISASFRNDSTPTTGTVELTSIEMEGSGDNPFGDNNCS